MVPGMLPPTTVLHGVHLLQVCCMGFLCCCRAAWHTFAASVLHGLHVLSMCSMTFIRCQCVAWHSFTVSVLDDIHLLQVCCMASIFRQCVAWHSFASSVLHGTHLLPVCCMELARHHCAALRPPSPRVAVLPLRRIAFCPVLLSRFLRAFTPSCCHCVPRCFCRCHCVALQTSDHIRSSPFCLPISAANV